MLLPSSPWRKPHLGEFVVARDGQGEWTLRTSKSGECPGIGRWAARRRGKARYESRNKQEHLPHAPRSALTEECAHDEAEIAAAHVNKQAFEDVLSTPKKQPAHTTSLEQMSIRAFEQLAALTPQRLSAVAANASTIGIHRLLCLRFVLPISTPAIRFGDVAANGTGFEIDQHLVAVIPLVGHHFRQRFGMQMFAGLGILRHGLQIRLGSRQRPWQRFRIALIGTRQSHGDDRLGVHVHRGLTGVKHLSGLATIVSPVLLMVFVPLR